MKKTSSMVEFGDFQTPLNLAKKVVNLIDSKYLNFVTIIEPNCGKGNFIKAILENNYQNKKIIAWDINNSYIEYLKDNLSHYIEEEILEVKEQDFFTLNWDFIDKKLNQPIFFIGNPPWVTNSELGKLMSKNIPCKNNFPNYIGLEAITGKSNFDISEWMLIKIAHFISGSNSAMAFLVKTSIARKLYSYICKNKLAISEVSIYEIDAWQYFKVNVSACLFFAQGNNQSFKEVLCHIYADLSAKIPDKIIGFYNNQLVANIEVYQNFQNIDIGCEFKWRSGIKHDCSKVMEFKKTKEGLKNGFEELIDIENKYLYPMYKSSDIAKNTILSPTKYMLITQQKIGDDTNKIADYAPKTWQYLQQYADLLNNRKSSIYKSVPKFSIFGVGEYSFKPWKIVISSLYKNINFTKIGEYQNKPIILDDTCYLLSFDRENQADFILNLLQSKIAQSFINSLVFPDSKRMITTNLLNRISLKMIAIELRRENEYNKYFEKESNIQYSLF